MTDQEQKDLRAYCASLLTKYGFQFTPDDPVIPALYIIHKEMELNNHNNKALAAQVREVSSRINPEEFKFYTDDAAWWFQLGITVRRTFIMVLIVFAIWGGAWHWSNANDVDQARVILETSSSLSKLIERAIKANDGNYYIHFTQAKADSIQRFKEFQKVNTTTIRIKLGKAIGKSKQ